MSVIKHMKDKIKYLFLQYYHNRSSRKELEDFFHIINSAKYDQEISDLIKLVYDEIKQTEPSLTYIDNEGNLVLREPDWIKEDANRDNVKPLRKRTAYLVAASFLILFSAGIWFWKSNAGKNITDQALIKQYTVRAEHKYILLSDSSQIWLNASTTLDYPEAFGAKKREVWLNGEAFFDIKHADKIPFIIHTGKVTTTVLGTAFNIKAYSGQHTIVVSVKRGKVSVLSQDKVVATLTPGQEVKVNMDANKLTQQTEKALNANDVGNWQQGYLSYDDETVQEVINDLQRVYNVDIKLTNDSIKNEVITTAFKRDIGPQKALEILSALTDAKLRVGNNGFTLN
ncbi:MAG: FecR domain-containing protein [Bacteroidetes bacterium]|nr:FecR domain-containing protein [Bacteroidota bacterium]